MKRQAFITRGLSAHVHQRERERMRAPWLLYLTLEQVTLPLWMLIAGCVK